MKFELSPNIYDTDMIASMEKLNKTIQDRQGGPPVTHVMYFKREYIRHESMLKGRFLTEDQANIVRAACLDVLEEPATPIDNNNRQQNSRPNWRR